MERDLMAGRGPRPKDPNRRARTNSDGTPTRMLRFEQADQPELPTLPKICFTVEDVVVEREDEWCPATLSWWERWGKSPQAEHFSSTDWDFLADAAALHNAYWSHGNLKVIAELRLRVAKVGATMEDRARLRMQFAEADEADSKRTAKSADSRAKYGALKAVEDPKTG